MNYSIQRQLTVALENTPGRLAAICEIISQQEINIEGICVVDNVEQGVVRLMTSDPAEAKRLLMGQGLYIVEADVLAVELLDECGALAKISAALATHKINIDYLYGSFNQTGTRTKFVLKVSDLTSAQSILGALDVS